MIYALFRARYSIFEPRRIDRADVLTSCKAIELLGIYQHSVFN